MLKCNVAWWSSFLMLSMKLKPKISKNKLPRVELAQVLGIAGFRQNRITPVNWKDVPRSRELCVPSSFQLK